jgi:hypothetical protein
MKSKQRTAAEVVAELQRDPEYVRMREEQEARLAAKERAFGEAEKPIVSALAAAGVKVSSIWDLVNTSARYPSAIPVLFEHIQRSYPDDLLESLARALARPEARTGWPTLLRLFKTCVDTRRNGAKTALAIALSAASDDSVIQDVVALVSDSTHGPHRIPLLPALARSRKEVAHRVLQTAVEDPELAAEARVQLRLARRRRK